MVIEHKDYSWPDKPLWDMIKNDKGHLMSHEVGLLSLLITCLIKDSAYS
ncbi:hypothetical protein [Malacoplasma penetrans]|nr:hypothetical protein [Malacoplasma penetrans]